MPIIPQLKKKKNDEFAEITSRQRKSIHLFKCFPGISHVPGTVLGTGDTALKKQMPTTLTSQEGMWYAEESLKCCHPSFSTLS